MTATCTPEIPYEEGDRVKKIWNQDRKDVQYKEVSTDYQNYLKFRSSSFAKDWTPNFFISYHAESIQNL